MKKLAALLISTVAMVGCKTDSPALTGAPKPPPPAIQRGQVERTQDGLQVSFDPRVDILFVIDDSLSMEKRFVDELAKVKAIDFHIGYTVSHDRGRYGTFVPQTCGGREEPNWEPVGSLRPLKGPSEKLPKDGRRYVTREDDFNAILKETLDPKVNVSLVKKLLNTANTPVADGCGYGPEEEEMFSPIVGLLEDKSLAVNNGFRRDGAYFVVIIVSDAKSADVNFGLTPETVMLKIAAATGDIVSDKKRFRVLSVAMKPGVMMDNAQCKPDPAFSEYMENGPNGPGWYLNVPRRVEEDENPLAVLAQLTHDENSSVDPILSICDRDYGDELARYGAQIKQDTLRDLQIQLPSNPQIFPDPKDADKNLAVFIGEDRLDKSMWKWSSSTGNGQGALVTIFGQKVDWDKYTGQKVRVTYVPVEFGAQTTKPLQ
jgi:hypothetical protein